MECAILNYGVGSVDLVTVPDDIDDVEVYLYDVGKRANLGCYTMKSLFKNTYNYKNRCSNNGNCGWKAAWVYTSK